MKDDVTPGGRESYKDSNSGGKIWNNSITRRRFLKRMGGATLGAALLAQRDIAYAGGGGTSGAEYEYGTEYALFISEAPDKLFHIHTQSGLVEDPTVPFTSAFSVFMQSVAIGPSEDPPGDAPSANDVNYGGGTQLQGALLHEFVPTTNAVGEKVHQAQLEHNGVEYALGTKVLQSDGDVTLEDVKVGNLFTKSNQTHNYSEVLAFQASLHNVNCEAEISTWAIKEVGYNDIDENGNEQQAQTSGSVTDSNNHSVSIALQKGFEAVSGVGYTGSMGSTSGSSGSTTHTFTDSSGKSRTMVLEPVTIKLEMTYSWVVVVATREWMREKASNGGSPGEWERVDSEGNGWNIPSTAP